MNASLSLARLIVRASAQLDLLASLLYGTLAVRNGEPPLEAQIGVEPRRRARTPRRALRQALAAHAEAG